MRVCIRCGKAKPMLKFRKDKQAGKRRSTCNACDNSRRQKIKENK